MGLLDNLTNGDPASGLLSFLASLQQKNGAPVDATQNDPYTASYAPQSGAAPTASAPVFAQPPMPSANQPSPLDSAQWPAGPIGAPSQANAQMQPSGGAPVPAPITPATTPAAPDVGIGDHLMAGYQNLRHGGGLIGSTIAALTGQRNDAQAVALQQQAQVANVTAKALLAKGIDPQVVAAAVAPGNTEMLKTLVTQAFGPQTVQSLGNGYIADKNGKVTRAYEPESKRTFVHYKDANGAEVPGVFDPDANDGKGGFAPIAVPAAKGPGTVDPDLTGPARLEALKKADPLYARKIEAMVNGDFPMPTGVAALKPESKRMIEDALAVDGSTSASDFQTRASTRRDYASGVASRVTKSINTTIGHFATLNDSIDKLNNWTYLPGLTNWVHDKYSSNLDPQYQKAKATFETNKEAAVKELDYALSGGHSSVSGSAELRDKFHRADSPETLHAAVTEAMSLLQKRLQSHTKAFTEGTKSQRDPQDFIYPENQQAFSKMLGDHADTSAAPPAVPALQPGGTTTINGVTIKRVN
jgi:hypothetical protein